MQEMTVTATVPEKKKDGKVVEAQLGPVSVTVPYASTLEEAKQLYGEEAVLTNAFANWRVTLQANIRGGLKRGETPEQIQSRLSTAKMGVAQQGVKVDPIQAFMAQFASATPEKQKQMLEELKKKAAAPVK